MNADRSVGSYGSFTAGGLPADAPSGALLRASASKCDGLRLAINLRALGNETTGVQRYLQSLWQIFSQYEGVRGLRCAAQSARGHAWEQLVLPMTTRGELLWSPANTGPLFASSHVVTIHDAATLDHPEWFNSRFSQWYRFALPRLLRQASRIITVSEFSRRRLLAQGPIDESRVVVIPNGVDARFKPAGELAVAETKARYSLERPYLLCVGSLEPRKNISGLLSAWTQLADSDRDLILVGAAGHTFRNRGFREYPENARLLGRVADEDLFALYSGALGFVFPSVYEGFGLPPLEAMACGCPVLVSNSSCLPETCGPEFDPCDPGSDGSAFYFDPTNVESIVDALRRIIALNPAERLAMGENGLRRASKFSWERTAEETWKVFQSVCH